MDRKGAAATISGFKVYFIHGNVLTKELLQFFLRREQEGEIKDILEITGNDFPDYPDELAAQLLSLYDSIPSSKDLEPMARKAYQKGLK